MRAQRVIRCFRGSALEKLARLALRQWIRLAFRGPQITTFIQIGTHMVESTSPKSREQMRPTQLLTRIWLRTREEANLVWILACRRQVVGASKEARTVIRVSPKSSKSSSWRKFSRISSCKRRLKHKLTHNRPPLNTTRCNKSLRRRSQQTVWRIELGVLVQGLLQVRDPRRRVSNSIWLNRKCSSKWECRTRYISGTRSNNLWITRRQPPTNSHRIRPLVDQDKIYEA